MPSTKQLTTIRKERELSVCGPYLQEELTEEIIGDAILYDSPLIIKVGTEYMTMLPPDMCCFFLCSRCYDPSDELLAGKTLCTILKCTVGKEHIMSGRMLHCCHDEKRVYIEDDRKKDSKRKNPPPTDLESTAETTAVKNPPDNKNL